MRLFLNIAVWLAVIAFCILIAYAAVMFSILLVTVIHANSHSTSLINSILIFCALVACVVMSLVIGHGIGETRRAK